MGKILYMVKEPNGKRHYFRTNNMRAVFDYCFYSIIPISMIKKLKRIYRRTDYIKEI